MTAQSVSVPRILQIDVGLPVGTSLSETFQGGVQVTGLENGLGSPVSPIFGSVDNLGTVDLVLSFQSSRNNNDPNPTSPDTQDAYSTINFRRNGASVASVTVKPGGRAVFAIDTLTEAFLKVNVPAGAFGRVTLVNFTGQLDKVIRSL